MPLLGQRDEWLRQSVESVLNQSVACELIVVVSSATPDSNRRLLDVLLTGQPFAKAVEQPPGARFPGAINHGFRVADTDRVGLLLSDDWLRPRAVERSVGLNADIVSTGSLTYLADGRTLLLSRFGDDRHYRQLKSNRERASYLSHFFLFRKDAFRAVGGVDENIGCTGVDDYDLIWSMLDEGASVAIVEERLYCFRDHGETRLTLQQPEIQIRSLKKLLDKHDVAGLERQALMESHAKWFGRPIRDVIDAQQQAVLGGVRTAGPGKTRRRLYTADDMQSGTGWCGEGRVICEPGRHAPGHCIYGPGIEAPIPCRLVVKFALELPGVVSPEDRQVTLDIYNQTEDCIVVIRDFGEAEIKSQLAQLEFDAVPGRRYEFRVYWHGLSAMHCQGLTVEADRAILPGETGARSAWGEAHCVKPRSSWQYRQSKGHGVGLSTIRAGEYFDHFTLLVQKRYPDSILDLEKAGLGENQVAAMRFAQLNLYAVDIEDLPEELLRDRDVYWHQQRLELPGLIASAGLHYPGGNRIVVQLLQSDLMQRYGLADEYRKYRTEIERRFKAWYKILLNGVLDHARHNQFKDVYCPASETALGRIKKPVDGRLFQRIYDYPSRNYNTRRVRSDNRDYWKIDVAQNESRILSLSSEIATWHRPRTICLLHDIEQDVETDVPVEECRVNLRKMLEIEKRHGVRGTYNVLGRCFGEAARTIRSFDHHALGFHSFDHRREGLDQLTRVRQISWRILGYRPPGSVISPELTTLNLARHNFEWLASSSHSLGFSDLRICNGIAMIPIHIDDHELYSGATKVDDWVEKILREARSREFFALSLHDCYASHWLHVYPKLLEALSSVARMVDCDALAGEMYRSTSRFVNPFIGKASNS